MTTRESSDMRESRQVAAHNSQRQSREDALRDLAREQAVQSPATGRRSDSPWQAPKRTRVATWRRWLAAALAAIVLVAGVTVYVVYQRHSDIQTAPVPPVPVKLTVSLEASGLICPTQVVWSPDARRIAVVAAKGVQGADCSQTAGPVIAIYDARTGKLLSLLDSAAELVPFGLVGTFYNLTWSRDGTQVLLDGFVRPTASTQGASYTPALVLLPIHSGVQRVFRGAPYSGPALPIWNAHSGVLADTLGPALPVALTYRWTPAGRITADLPMPSGTAQFTGDPVSSPGGHSIPFWQPGSIVPIFGADSSGAAPPVAEAYQGSATLWSPDGQYVAMGLITAGLLSTLLGQTPPTLSPRQCYSVGLALGCASTPVPYPDVALAAVRAAADRGAQFSLPGGGKSSVQWVSVPVAWRPNGRYLATILPDDQVDGSSLIVSVFKSDESTPITRLSMACTPHCAGTSTGAKLLLFWSPTGQQLATYDFDSDAITIWGGASLPT